MSGKTWTGALRTGPNTGSTLERKLRPISQQQWEQICSQLLRHLAHRQDANPFMEPVDPIKWDVLDYYDIIKEPMDLGTVRDNLQHGRYKHYTQVLQHVQLVFENARKYNPLNNPVYRMATNMSTAFLRYLRRVLPQLKEAAAAAPLPHAAAPAEPDPSTRGSRLAAIKPYSPDEAARVVSYFESQIAQAIQDGRIPDEGGVAGKARSTSSSAPVKRHRTQDRDGSDMEGGELQDDEGSDMSLSGAARTYPPWMQPSRTGKTTIKYMRMPSEANGGVCVIEVVALAPNAHGSSPVWAPGGSSKGQAPLKLRSPSEEPLSSLGSPTMHAMPGLDGEDMPMRGMSMSMEFDNIVPGSLGLLQRTSLGDGCMPQGQWQPLPAPGPGLASSDHSPPGDSSTSTLPNSASNQLGTVQQQVPLAEHQSALRHPTPALSKQQQGEQEQEEWGRAHAQDTPSEVTRLNLHDMNPGLQLSMLQDNSMNESMAGEQRCSLQLPQLSTSSSGREGKQFQRSYGATEDDVAKELVARNTLPPAMSHMILTSGSGLAPGFEASGEAQRSMLGKLGPALSSMPQLLQDQHQPPQQEQQIPTLNQSPGSANLHRPSDEADQGMQGLKRRVQELEEQLNKCWQELSQCLQENSRLRAANERLQTLHDDLTRSIHSRQNILSQLDARQPGQVAEAAASSPLPTAPIGQQQQQPHSPGQQRQQLLHARLDGPASMGQGPLLMHSFMQQQQQQQQQPQQQQPPQQQPPQEQQQSPRPLSHSQFNLIQPNGQVNQATGASMQAPMQQSMQPPMQPIQLKITTMPATSFNTSGTGLSSGTLQLQGMGMMGTSMQPLQGMRIVEGSYPGMKAVNLVQAQTQQGQALMPQQMHGMQVHRMQPVSLLQAPGGPQGSQGVTWQLVRAVPTSIASTTGQVRTVPVMLTGQLVSPQQQQQQQQQHASTNNSS